MYDLFSRYVGGLREQVGWIAGASVFWVVAGFLLRRPLRVQHERRWYAAATVALLAGACAWALTLGWVGDDAYISFRYIRNFVEGHGLVYNPGERVEGYTNFLWVMLLSPFAALGLDLALTSIVATLACLCGVVALTAHLARRFSPERLPFSIAAVVLALNYVIACYGTSGLETMLGALLVLAAVERADRGAAASAGTLGILATMTHPDHAIFYAALGATLLWSKARWRLALRYALPFLCLYVPYFAWRWSYYGDFFPNTYYAKNADLVYFRQGFRYLGISGWSAGLWAALPAAVVGIVRFRRLTIARFAAIATPLFLLYVAKIGGDFMLGRLLVPLLPPLFILAELGIRSLVREDRRWRQAVGLVALAVLCTAMVPVRLIRPGEKYRYLADERTFYPIEQYYPFELGVIYWNWSKAFNRVFSTLTRKPNLAMGSLGIIGYQTSLRMIDSFGLVHRGVAHTRVRTRGRPGHEKLIGPGMLVQSGADLSELAVYPPEYDRHGAVNVAGVVFSTVRYDASLFSELERAGVRQPGLLRFIDNYRPPRGKGAAERLACDLWYMEQVYFSHNLDPERRHAIVRRVLNERRDWRGYEEFILQEPSAEQSSWLEVSRVGFDQLPAGSERSGAAFENNPVARESAGQGAPAGHQGRFINTFQELDADVATGSLLLPELVIEGEVITLRVGGGRQPEAVLAELLVDGERRFAATGCNTEILGRRIWPTADLVGKRARLRLVDASSAGWGHLLVDEIVQWRRVRPTSDAYAIDPTFQR